MKKAALVLTMLSALFVAPAQAHGWRGHHWHGPGIGFGLVAGALAAGLAADAYYPHPTIIAPITGQLTAITGHE
jgi:hypothetical protein